MRHSSTGRRQNASSGRCPAVPVYHEPDPVTRCDRSSDAPNQLTRRAGSLPVGDYVGRSGARRPIRRVAAAAASIRPVGPAGPSGSAPQSRIVCANVTEPSVPNTDEGADPVWGASYGVWGYRVRELGDESDQPRVPFRRAHLANRPPVGANLRCDGERSLSEQSRSRTSSRAARCSSRADSAADRTLPVRRRCG
jgi:hypothetical protein